MQTYQARERISKTVSNNRSYQSAHRGAAFQSSASSPVLQARIQEMANNSSHVKQLQAYQRMADNSGPVIQKRENRTGLPDRLKAGVERLSGMDLSDVRVHYNSSKPAQLRAMAYAQGTDIYIGPGQEKHLPHEAWHVVQQKQGRVQATTHSLVEKPVQRYVPVDLDESQQWLDIRNEFPSFRSVFNAMGKDTERNYSMTYITGSPDSSELNVSDKGQLAINATGGNEFHKTFFINENLLMGSALPDLKQAGSKFTLEPTGNAITVHDHPETHQDHHLIQVKAKHEQGEDIAKALKSRCDQYYKHIAGKAVQSWKAISLYEAIKDEKRDTPISEERRLEMISNPAYKQLKAGDAFEIMPFSGDYIIGGWNEHFAGIVAVDGEDQVTLENFNRDTELNMEIIRDCVEQFGTSYDQLECDIAPLTEKISDKNTDNVNLTEMKSNLDTLNQLREKLEKVINQKTIQEGVIDTNHFKMYGSPLKKQSFLDVWRGKMGRDRNDFKIIPNNRS